MGYASIVEQLKIHILPNKMEDLCHDVPTNKKDSKLLVAEYGNYRV